MAAIPDEMTPEIRLEALGKDCPANFIEMLTKRKDFHIDFVSIQDRIGWAKNNNTLYVWDFEAKGTAKQLQLHSAELQDNSKLFLAFKDTGRPVASALALNLEGSARYWPSVNSQHHVDVGKIKELQEEVPIGLHLIRRTKKEKGEPDAPPLFGVVTTSGTALTMEMKDGSFLAKRIADKAPEKKSRFSSFFSPGRKPKRGDFRQSTHVRLEEDDDGAQRDLLVAIAPQELAATDVTKNVDLWQIKKESIEGHLADRMRGRPGAELVAKFVDAKAFQGGLVALVCSYYEFSDYLEFYLVQIKDIEGNAPQLGSVVHLNLEADMIERLKGYESDDFRVTHNPNNVRLVVPDMTTSSTRMAMTDGILIVHDDHIHSVYPPGRRGAPVNQIFFALADPMRNQIVGYGCDATSVYVITNQGVTSVVRVLPKAFPDPRDQPLISKTIGKLVWPDRTMESAFLRALLAFSAKEMTNAAEICEDLVRGVLPTDLLAVIRETLWKVAAKLDPSPQEFLDQVREKERFYRFYVLFLNYFGVLDRIVGVAFKSPLTDQVIKGAEAITEVFERLKVAETMSEWAKSSKPLVGECTTDEEDVLRNLITRIPKAQGMLDHWRLLEYQHLLPHAALKALDDVTRNMGSYKSVEEICAAFFLFGDYFEHFNTGIRVARNTMNLVKTDRTSPRWSTEIYDLLPEICSIFLEKMKNAVFSTESKKRFLEYVKELTANQLRELHPALPSNHPVLLKLIEERHLEEALKLAEEFKDFPVLCQIVLTYKDEDRRAAVDGYKVKYAADDFEERYLAYLVRNKEFKVLLEEKGEKAATFIGQLHGVRWVRDIENGDMKKASASLLEEGRREQGCLKKKQALLSIGLLASLADDRPRDEEAEQKEILLRFGVRKSNFQQRIPRDIFQMIYPGHGDNEMPPLNVEELHEIAKMIVEDEACTMEMYKEVISYAGALTFVIESIPEHTRKLLALAWLKVLEKDDWSRMSDERLHDTLFAKVVEKLFDEDPEIIVAVLPSADFLHQTSPRLHHSDSWPTVCGLLDHAKRVADQWLETGNPPL